MPVARDLDAKLRHLIDDVATRWVRLFQPLYDAHVPVVDLRTRFGLPRTELSLDTRIIVIECEGRVVALRVDSAREVLKLDVDKHQPAPSIVSERSSGLVQAVHPLGKRLLLLIDLPKLLGENSYDRKPRALPEDDGSNTRFQLPS